MKHTSLLLAFLSAFALALPVSAERPKDNPYEKYLIFWGYPDNYLDNQTRMAFQEIDRTLRAYPPKNKDCQARRMALTALDLLLHDTRNDKTPAFYDFINARMANMLADMQKGCKKGVKIYKLYNDGFIIQSPKTTVAIDLVPGGPETHPFISDSLIYAIAGQCDAMFISHAHGDHANLRIAQTFAARGKRVIVPKGLWTGIDPNIEQLLVADTAVGVPFDELNLKLTILPGHQDDMYNNIYLMTFANGITVAHTGDQYNEDDLAWIDRVHDTHRVDVLLLNCWVNAMPRTIAGFAPKQLITGHENEMEHSIDHREAYWMTMEKTRRMGIGNVLMSWGECFHYTPPKTK